MVARNRSRRLALGRLWLLLPAAFAAPALAAAGLFAFAAPGSAAPAAATLLSQGKPVTASSSGGCCPAANAVDGNSATRWASAAGVDPQWIYVDLGATAHVSRVRLQWDASCATAYEIDTSADHATWTKIYSHHRGQGRRRGPDLPRRHRPLRADVRHETLPHRRQPRLLAAGVRRLRHASAATPPRRPRPARRRCVSDTSSSVTITWTAVDRQRRRHRLRRLPRRPALRRGRAAAP